MLRSGDGLLFDNQLNGNIAARGIRVWADLVGELDELLGGRFVYARDKDMHSAWVGFITRGDPGWPQYDLDQRQTMHFDASSELLKDPRSAERALWEGLR
jgi:carboxylesterase type B